MVVVLMEQLLEVAKVVLEEPCEMVLGYSFCSSNARPVEILEKINKKYQWPN